MKKLYLYIFLVLMWCSNVNAEYLYKEYRQNPSDYYEYLHGLGDGIGWSITFQEEIGPRFFCQPRNLAIGRKEYIEMFENQAAILISKLGKDEVDEIYLGWILAYAHQNKFSCK
tara:strand:+ start:2182 stop:2523 length:342 start_codon:yes stop_codon:yes gene_type:complete